MLNIDLKMTVSELLRVHPSTINVFIQRKMLCVGCPTETFHTLEDAVRIYNISLRQLLKELRVVIDAQEGKDSDT